MIASRTPEPPSTDARRPRVKRLTPAGWNAQLLYFTGPSLTSDGRTLVVLGDRDRPAQGPYDPAAAVNVFAIDVATRSAERLSRNEDGVRRSYVYFGGRRASGLAPGSVALDAVSGTILYVEGSLVHRVSVHGAGPEPIAAIPDGVVTGYGGISDDGRRYAIPIVDEAAFVDLHAIDATVTGLGLASRILVLDTETGDRIDEIVVPDGWVTHVSFRPGDPTTILYNHEWAACSGIRRLWIADRRSQRPLRTQLSGSGRPEPVDSADDVEHESWTRDGSAVVYHGTYHRRGPLSGRAFVGRITVPGLDLVEVPLPTELTRYGHVSAGNGRFLVTDGIAEPATPAGAAARTTVARLDGADAPGEDDGGRWITRIDVDWAARELCWEPLTEHGSSWSSQDAHPHPVFDHAGESVLFTSDRDGYRAVYRVDLGERR